MGQANLLLVEQDPALRRSLKACLLRFGIVKELNRADELSDSLSKCKVDLVILGTSNGCGFEGIHSVRGLRKVFDNLPFIFLVRDSCESLAIEALRAGIKDYFKAPYNLDDITASVDRILQSTTSQPAEKRSELLNRVDQLIGHSSGIQEVRNYVSQLAATSSNVLLTGETGTGKELVAQSIHRTSARAHKPFICINCAAVPDTLMESEFFGYERGAFTGAQSNKQGKLALANGGTVFLDEIGDMSIYMQAKILRAIEGKEIQPLGARGSIPVDFRVIAATNQDLDRLALENRFRQDLYFRLNVGRIHVPPLRERKEDIPLLIDYYISYMNDRFGRSVKRLVDGVLEHLLRYNWPGNIRELKNTLEAAYTQLPSEQTCELDLPNSFRKRLLGSLETLPRDERDHLLSTLAATNWNKSVAAQKLQWSRMTLYRKMAKYQINRSVGAKNAHSRGGRDVGSDAA